MAPATSIGCRRLQPAAVLRVDVAMHEPAQGTAHPQIRTRLARRVAEPAGKGDPQMAWDRQEAPQLALEASSALLFHADHVSGPAVAKALLCLL